MNSTIIIEHEVDSINFLAKLDSNYKIYLIIFLSLILFFSILLFRSMKE